MSGKNGAIMSSETAHAFNAAEFEAKIEGCISRALDAGEPPDQKTTALLKVAVDYLRLKKGDGDKPARLGSKLDGGDDD